MASVTTQKRINLTALDTALGGHGLNASGDLRTTVMKTISTLAGSPVTDPQLQAAVDAHVYVEPPTIDERIDALVSAIPTVPPLGSAAALNVGTTAGTVAAGNDARLSDARTPTAHTHPSTAITGLGTAATKDTGTGATQVVLGNDARLTDARAPTAHTHPVAQVTGLHAVATTGAYSDLSGKPTSMTPTAHTHPVGEVTGLHAVASSGDYNALTNKPAIPAAVVARAAVVASGALTANVVKNVSVTWPTPMPSANYAIAATPVSTAPNTLNTSIVSQTAAGCVIAIRSTAAVAGGVNLHCIGVA